MTCNNIYEISLSLIGEPTHNISTADYGARAIKLFSVVLTRFARLSKELSGAEIDASSLYITTLNTDYPLDERLVPAVSLSLASLLILDELPEVSAELERLASDAAADIAKDAVSVGSVTEVY